MILGNCGSGKSWLAARLAARGNLRHVELDELRWSQSGFGKKRSAEEAIASAKGASANDRWVIECVFGWL